MGLQQMAVWKSLPKITNTEAMVCVNVRLPEVSVLLAFGPKRFHPKDSMASDGQLSG